MSIARSGIFWMMAKFLTVGLSWLALIYFTRALDSPGRTLGQYYLFETVVAFFVLTSNGGVNQALTKRISEQKDPHKYIGAGVLLTTAFLILASSVLLLTSDILIGYFSLGASIIVFALLSIWGSQVFRILSSVLEGYSRVGLSGGISLLEIAMKVLVQILLVGLGYGLTGLLTGAVVAPIVASLVAAWVLKPHVRKPGYEHVRSLISFAKYAMPREFTSKFYDNVDTIVIAWILGNAAVGYYNVGFRFALVLTVFSSSIGVASFPEISRLVSEERIGRVEEILNDALVFSTLLAIPATVGLAVLADRVIITLYTEEMLAATTVAVIAVATKIPDSIRYVFNSGMDGLNRPELTLHAGIILIVTNAVLDVILVPRIGIEGAAIASFVGISLSGGYTGVMFVRHLNLNIGDLPIPEIVCQTISALLMAGVVIGLDNALSLAVIPQLSILIVAGTLSYFVILLVISRGIRNRFRGIAADFVSKFAA